MGETLPDSHGHARFELVRNVRNGGQALVFEAVDLVSRVLVCVRVFRSPLHLGHPLAAGRWASLLTRYRAGFDTLKKLHGRDPSLVPQPIDWVEGHLFDGMASGAGYAVPYAVVAWFPGGDLCDALMRLPERARRQRGHWVVVRVLERLAQLHEAGVSHDDPWFWNALVYEDAHGLVGIALTDFDASHQDDGVTDLRLLTSGTWQCEAKVAYSRGHQGTVTLQDRQGFDVRDVGTAARIVLTWASGGLRPEGHPDQGADRLSPGLHRLLADLQRGRWPTAAGALAAAQAALAAAPAAEARPLTWADLVGAQGPSAPRPADPVETTLPGSGSSFPSTDLPGPAYPDGVRPSPAPATPGAKTTMPDPAAPGARPVAPRPAPPSAPRRSVRTGILGVAGVVALASGLGIAARVAAGPVDVDACTVRHAPGACAAAVAGLAESLDASGDARVVAGRRLAELEAHLHTCALAHDAAPEPARWAEAAEAWSESTQANDRTLAFQSLAQARFRRGELADAYLALEDSNRLAHGKAGAGTRAANAALAGAMDCGLPAPVTPAENPDLARILTGCGYLRLGDGPAAYAELGRARDRVRQAPVRATRGCAVRDPQEALVQAVINRVHRQAPGTDCSSVLLPAPAHTLVTR